MSSLRVIEARIRDPHDDVALDTTLFRELEENAETPETLRFWECDRTAVIVSSLSAVHGEVREDACAEDEVPILRRASGGGAVVVGPGCLSEADLL